MACVVARALVRSAVVLAGLWLVVPAERAEAQQAASLSCSASGECLCDSSYEDCRTPLLQLIRNEPPSGGIDVSIWFMSDARYSSEIIKRWQAGVPVRVIVDTEADADYAGNKAVRDALVAARIPIRNCTTSAGINHWKAMIFAGQRKVQFSAANYANGSLSPIVPYTEYVDEAIYFTDDDSIVQSFMKKFDDHWTDTVNFTNFANITTPLARNYPTYAIDPSLNFVPDQHFENRLVSEIAREGVQIDAVIFRILSAKVPDALIARHKAGVDVRLITEEEQYRNTSKFWHAYNVDRMYAEGIPIKVKNNVTEQDVHQKSIVLHTRSLATDRAPMVVFGSSNWTTSSSTGQREHNYFSRKPWMVNWFIDQFERKWTNTRVDGSPIGTQVFKAFTPLPPQTPVYASPVNDAVGQATTVTLKWEGGWWAHKYDIYVDTDGGFSAPPVIVDYMPSFSTSGVTSAKESFTVTGLLPGTTYYWKVVSKTMANVTKTGLTWRFTTAGTAATPPPTDSGTTAADVVLYPGDAVRVGNWKNVSDATGAAGRRLQNPDAAASKLTTALASPANYFEMKFNAEAGRPYRLWMRMKALNNSPYNDSVHVQFSNAVNGTGSPVFRIGTSGSTEINLEDCSGCGLRDWGWQDNGWGVGVMGPAIYFATSGPQTIRVQVREDGVGIDQVVLSPGTYLNRSPGALKSDTVILPRQP